MGTAGLHPTARGLLAWMQAGGPRLRALMAEEAATAEDLSPAGDAAVRAHLRFLAEALAANAGPGRAGALAGRPSRKPASAPAPQRHGWPRSRS